MTSPEHVAAEGLPTFKIRELGEIEGRDFNGVVLEGGIEAIRYAARFFMEAACLMGVEEAAALRRPAPASHANAVGWRPEFQTGTPIVATGNCRIFLALMVGKHTGKDIVLPLYYLNAMPLEMDECKCSEEHDEGCPTTGWFYDESNFEYEHCYYRAEGEVVAWAELPSGADVRALLTAPPDSCPQKANPR